MEGENEIVNENVPDNSITGETREVGPGKPPKDKQFSADRQPTTEQRQKEQKTKRRKKEMRELVRDILSIKINFPPGSNVEKQMRQMFGDRIDKLPFGLLIQLRQGQVALLQGDTQAAKEIFYEGYGPQKQATEISGPNGGAIVTEQITHQVIIQRRDQKTAQATE